MLTINDSLREAIPEELRRKIELKGKIIPLFGDLTGEIVRELHECIERRVNFSQDAGLILSFLEHQALVGALIASRSQEKTHELCSGLGIPSLTYSLLTNKPSIAVDINPEEIKRGRRIKFLLGDPKTSFLELNAEYYLMNHNIGRGDAIIAVYPSGDVLTNIIERPEPKERRIILAGFPAGFEEAFYTYPGSKEKPIMRTHRILRQYSGDMDVKSGPGAEFIVMDFSRD